jgi:arginine/serine-rich splicing factor 4/5/6
MPGSGKRVYIGNLSNDCRDRDIEKFFKGYGKLGDISVKNGYGFVDFDDDRDADDACQDMDGKELLGARYVIKLVVVLSRHAKSSSTF